MKQNLVQLPVLQDAEVNLCVFAGSGTRAFTAVQRDPVRLWDLDKDTVFARTTRSVCTRGPSDRPMTDDSYS